MKQVQDLKSLIRILPLWSTSIFLCTPIAVNNSLVVLQALTMDRHIGFHLKIPAGTMLVSVILAAAISLPIIDRLLYPGWKKLTNRYPSALQRIGVGYHKETPILNYVECFCIWCSHKDQSVDYFSSSPVTTDQAQGLTCQVANFVQHQSSWLKFPLQQLQ